MYVRTMCGVHVPARSRHVPSVHNRRRMKPAVDAADRHEARVDPLLLHREAIAGAEHEQVALDLAGLVQLLDCRYQITTTMIVPPQQLYYARNEAKLTSSKRSHPSSFAALSHSPVVIAVHMSPKVAI